MNTGRTIFSQIIDTLDRKEFQRCLSVYPMPRESRSFTARDQFLSIAFAQVTFRESLRNIEACLNGCRHLYSMGFRGNITRTKLRRICFVDAETGKRLVFITNHFGLHAITIAHIYKSRWHIELFFKWIKQNLRIKTFYVTTENAVKTQIWIAICGLPVSIRLTELTKV